MIDLKKIKHIKPNMSEDQKKKLLIGLKRLVEKKKLLIGRKASAVSVKENEYTARMMPERNVIAKEFDTEVDYDSYVKQRRGIQITDKELQSVSGYTKTRPTQSDNFSIKYESGDDFGNNETTIIKKLKEGDKFCWVAFVKFENAATATELQEALPEKNPSLQSTNTSDSQQPPQSDQDNSGISDEPDAKPPIRVIKSITFSDDTTGSNILSDFIRKLDV